MGFTARLILMAKRHWGTLAVACLGIIGAALLNLVTPEIVRRLTASLELPGGANTQLPVSYTHLDVYKRQRSWWPVTAGMT